MFETFSQSVVLTRGSVATSPWKEARLIRADGYVDFSERYAGCGFEDGLYRIHDADTGPLGLQLLSDAFPQFSERAVPFGYDWLGRQFALDRERTQGSEQLMLLLEPGTGQALELPMTFAAFHEQLDGLREPALANKFFLEWVQANPTLVPLAQMACVGYRVPLFLGGKDVVDNLEVIDMDVYWTLCAQLRSGTRQMKTGATIKQVSATG